MNNSVFGAPGVFGGPSLFGAAELDPMFANSNPATAAVMQEGLGAPSVFGVPAVSSLSAPSVVSFAQVKAAQQRYRSAREMSEKAPGNKMLRSIAMKLQNEFRALKARYETQMGARGNPLAVRGKVSFGGGRRQDARESLAVRAANSWKVGKLEDARVLMASYRNQNGTKLGFKNKGTDALISSRRGDFKSWVDRNWGKVSGTKVVRTGTQTRTARIGKTTIQQRNAVYGMKKTAYAVGRSGKRSKIVGRVPASADSDTHEASAKRKSAIRGKPKMRSRIRQRIQSRQSARTTGSTVGSMLAARRVSGGLVSGMIPELSGRRVSIISNMPLARRISALQKIASPLVRIKRRQVGGQPFLMVRQQIPAMKSLPRPEYRIRRQEVLVDKTTEAVLERLKADPNFANLSFEEKVAATTPLAQAAENEVAAVEVEAQIAPPTEAEEMEVIAEMDDIIGDEMDPAEYDYLDEITEDTYEGVFGSFGSPDEDLGDRVEAAATAAVEAIEADIAIAEGEAEAEIADEDASRKKMFMYVGLAALAFAIIRR